MSHDQERWNDYGRRRIAAIEKNPEAFKITADAFPMPNRLDDHQVADLLAAVGDLRGKRVLEVGCGCEAA